MDLPTETMEKGLEPVASNTNMAASQASAPPGIFFTQTDKCVSIVLFILRGLLKRVLVRGGEGGGGTGTGTFRCQGLWLAVMVSSSQPAHP